MNLNLKLCRAALKFTGSQLCKMQVKVINENIMLLDIKTDFFSVKYRKLHIDRTLVVAVFAKLDQF